MQIQNKTIRQATHEDIRRLQALADDMKLVKDPDYFDMQYDRQASGDRLLLIISADGHDAGYCVLNWHPKYAFFKKLGIPEIQDLNVLKDLRRKGLARSMIRHCEDLARQKGHETMGIGVGLNASFGPAQNLYVREGYIPDGNGINYDRQPVSAGEFRPVDDNLCLMMVKRLNATD